MNQPPIRAVGIPWYTLDDFAEIKAMMEDGHKLAATYSQWRMAAEQAEKKFRREGCLVVRAALEPKAFRDYCLLHDLRLDAHGRGQFAAFIAKEQHGTTH
jgi:hypothetical protein